MSAEEVMTPVLEDAPYYAAQGGMTLSGGEPVLQAAFCQELLQAAQAHDIHTVIETAGNVPAAQLLRLAPWVDLLLFDLKAWSDGIYHTYIHGNRAQILDTLAAWSDTGKPVIVRTPVVGGLNDRAEEIEAISRHIAPLPNLLYYQLIPYHALGRAKYDALDMAYPYDFTTPTPEAMRALEDTALAWVHVYNQQDGVQQRRTAL